MDGISHMAWSYLLWLDNPYTWLAVFFGILPDLVGVVPPSIAAGIRQRSWKALLLGEGGPKWMQTYQRIAHPLSHSMVVSLGVFGATAVIWSPQWYLLAWPLHNFVDIFTHTKERGPQWLWPLSKTRFHGVSWDGRRFLTVNALALVLVATVLLWH